jgi:hypothetical protein
MAMSYYMHLMSPIGRLLLTSEATALTGLYMEVSGRGGGPVLGPEARADATAGVLPEAAGAQAVAARARGAELAAAKFN